MDKPRKILVIGATGYVGSHLVPALLSEGHTVIATSRSVETLQQLRWHAHPNVELRPLDLSQEAIFQATLKT